MQPLTALNVLSDTSSNWTIKEAISEVAIKYGIEKSGFMKTIACESSFNTTAKNKSSTAYGLGQFLIGTWNTWNKKRGTNLDRYNPKDQLDMMAWAFKQGFQKHWLCWKPYFTN